MLKKTLITSASLLLCLCTVAQTKEIAWKSHSGNPTFFNPSSNGDLGLNEPDPVLVKIVKVNDTTFIKTFERPNGNGFHETIYNDLFWMKPSAELDSLVRAYYPTTKMVGFEQNTAPLILKKPLKERKNK